MSKNTSELSEQDSWQDVEIFLNDLFTDLICIDKLYLSDFMNKPDESILRYNLIVTFLN